MPEREGLDPCRALPQSFFSFSLHGAHGRSGATSCATPPRNPDVQVAVCRPRGGWGLCIRPHGIRGPLTKTGANPPGQTSSNRANGALLAPGRRDPVEDLLEHRVTGQRAPGDFDEHVTDTTGALAAKRAAPHGGPRRLLAGRQPRVAEQRPLIGKACHVAQCGREGPCGDLANPRDTPLPLFDLRLRLGLFSEQAAHLDELACGKAPLLSQQRQTRTQLWRQRPRGHLP
jgi:hypothetical protein